VPAPWPSKPTLTRMSNPSLKRDWINNLLRPLHLNPVFPCLTMKISGGRNITSEGEIQRDMDLAKKMDCRANGEVLLELRRPSPSKFSERPCPFRKVNPRWSDNNCERNDHAQ